MGAKYNTDKGLVYIVDDEPLLVELAEDILAQEGFTTKLFLSGEDALSEFRARPVAPRILITDCVMGGMDGLQLIQEFKQLVPPLKTILVSGTVEERFIGQQAIKPDRFLQKPYNVQSLIEAVHSVAQ